MKSLRIFWGIIEHGNMYTMEITQGEKKTERKFE
jgi:hypothetical protein